jgi:hypothetical protein
MRSILGTTMPPKAVVNRNSGTRIHRIYACYVRVHQDTIGAESSYRRAPPWRFPGELV